MYEWFRQFIVEIVLIYKLHVCLYSTMDSEWLN